MSRTRTPSANRPAKAVDADVLHSSRSLVASIERRALLRGALSLGALTALTGCDISNEGSVQGVLRTMSEWNDRVQGFLFDRNRLAPTYPESEVLKPPRFNAFYGIDEVKPVDVATWKLELAGLVADKRPWTLDRIKALPHVSQVTRHVCVEGWDYIGKWTGVPLKLFLETIGADTSARYVSFTCADGYTSSLDMATALHPQTQLTTMYADEILGDAYGYPLRLRAATKLGFKTPKWITAIGIGNAYTGGYWENRGYNWFSGI